MFDVRRPGEFSTNSNLLMPVAKPWLRMATCELKAWAGAEVGNAVRPTSTRKGGNWRTACMQKGILQFMRHTCKKLLLGVSLIRHARLRSCA